MYAENMQDSQQREISHTHAHTSMADMETVGEGARLRAENAGAWVDTTPYTEAIQQTY